MKIEDLLQLLGTKQRDRVTGFAGMVSSLSFDAYGCVQVILTPKVGDDGKLRDVTWFDVNRLEPGVAPSELIIGSAERVMPAPDFAAYGLSHGPASKPTK